MNTVIIYASTDCAFVAGTSPTYSTARSTATSHHQAIDPDNYLVDAGVYKVMRSFLKFDTSVLPYDAEIVSAQLRMTKYSHGAFRDFTVEIIKQNWIAYDPITAGNRDDAFDGCLAGTLDINLQTFTPLTPGVPQTYYSSNLDMTRISKTGSTYYSLRSDRDADNDAPPSDEWVFFYGAESVNPDYKPALIVNYTNRSPEIAAEVPLPKQLRAHLQEIGLTAIVYEPIHKGTNKIAELSVNMNSYSHELAANGGFDKMRITLADNRVSLDEWIEQGLGRRIVVHNNAGLVVWEGFINYVDAQMGAHKISVGPLVEVGNRVSVSYAPLDIDLSPPVVGDTTVTPIAENETSQDHFGIIETVLTAGRVTDDEAELIRDTYLVERAYPETSSQLAIGSGAGDISVTLECLGYYYWTNLYVFNSSDPYATQVDDRMRELLEGNPNTTMFGQIVIETNNTIIPSETEEDKTAMAQIKEIMALGGAADQRYILGCYEERKFVYESIPTLPAYKTTLSDQGQRILTYEGAMVYPWDVRPGRWIFISDALVGRYTYTTNYYEDPRYMFIESVSFTAPWQITLSGSRIGTFDQVMARFGLGSF